MKYSLNWVKKLVALPESVDIANLKELLWSGLAEIESVTDYSKAYEKIIIGKIVKVEAHPKSEKLLVVTLDIGTKHITVVTGAHNVKENDFVPYIPVGAAVPRAILSETEAPVLESKDMHGVMSEGMLASKYELNLGTDHSGILIIKDTDTQIDLEPGISFAKALELDDTVVEIENKAMTHRGDAFSIVGIAREVSAITKGSFNAPEWLEPNLETTELYAEEFTKEFVEKITLDVQATDVVPRYSAVLLSDVRIEESPLWLQAVLVKHDIQPINNVVDITNYIMLEWGQPLHAFDAGSIKKAELENNYHIVVRRAKEGEKIATLDNKEHVLTPESIVIADSEKALAIAGVIGGKNSAIADTTTKVILESAVFDMYAVRKTSMLQGIFTDASTVFSRKQDPNKTVKAMLRAVELLKKYAGARVISKVADSYPVVHEPVKMVISADKYRYFAGVATTNSEIVEILKSLNYQPKLEGDLIHVIVPTYRQDVLIDEDLYEDIIRISGYTNVVPMLPNRPLFALKKTHAQQVESDVRNTLIAQGMLETLNFSFISEDLYKKMGISVDDCYHVLNAISPDVQYVRKLVAPALLQQAIQNQYNADTFGIFEFGLVSRKDYVYGSPHKDMKYAAQNMYGSDDYNLPIEDKHVAVVLTAQTENPIYYELKQYVEALIQAKTTAQISFRHIDDLDDQFKASVPMWIMDAMNMTKKARTAIIVATYEGADMPIGILGEVSTPVALAFGAQKQFAVCEIAMPTFAQISVAIPRYREPSKYPSISSDYCFEVNSNLSYETLKAAIDREVVDPKTQGIIQNVEVVDIFSKAKDKKRITFRITYQSYDKTLNDKEVRVVEKQLLDSLKAQIELTVI